VASASWGGLTGFIDARRVASQRIGLKFCEGYRARPSPFH
jgi:hypothetical protein